MDLRYVKKIIRLLEQSGVDEIEIEEEGSKIRVARNIPSNGVMVGGAPAQFQHAPAAHAHAVTEAAPAAAPKPAEPQYHEVKSPIVGTFYLAPAPDADPYIEIGQSVQAGTVLCIIEAMKLMNEIESDIAGRVVKVCVENGRPVEYNQPLFLVEPA